MVIPKKSAALFFIVWSSLAIIVPLPWLSARWGTPQRAIAQTTPELGLESGSESKSPSTLSEEAENASGEGTSDTSDGASTEEADIGIDAAIEDAAIEDAAIEDAAIEDAEVEDAAIEVEIVPPIGGILYSTSIAYSPDGSRIAVTGDQGTVRLFDAAGNAVGDPLDGLTGQLSTLAFSPDGSFIVGATDDGSIQVWDRQGNAIGNPFTGHESAITALVFHPDGDSIATAGADGTVRRWDLEGNSIGDPFTGHRGAVNGIAFNPVGDAIASAGADGTIRLWTLGGDLIAPPIESHEGAVNSIAFSPTGETIASAGVDGTVRLWNRQGSEIITPMTGHEGAVNAVAVTPDGTALLSAGTNGTLRLWGIDGQPIAPPVDAGQGAIAAIAIHPNGTAFISGGTDGTIRLWAIDGTPISEPLTGYISSVTPARGKPPAWIWWVLPLALLAILILWAMNRRRPQSAHAGGASSVPGNGEGVSPHLMAALSLAGVGKRDEALEQFNRLVQQEPSNTVAWTARGNLLNDLGHHQDALESFNTALKLQADLPQALTGKGLALTALGQVDEAIPIFDRAVTANRRLPDFNLDALATGGTLLVGGTALTAKALSGKGTALLKANQPNAALAAFDEALTEDLQSVEAIAGRNRALMMIGHIGESTPPAPTPPSSLLSDPSASPIPPQELADVDQNLPDLPDGYGDSRIVLLPRDPQWAFAYWDVPNEHKDVLRQQGGVTHALRLYDVTNIDLAHQNPHSLQQYPCDELAQNWYLPIPVSDRDYVVEIGYVTGEGNWLMLARSAPVRMPPMYPSDWVGDQFLTVAWDEDLRGKTPAPLTPPDQASSSDSSSRDLTADQLQSAETQRMAGSLFGSMQQVPQEAISSYVFPSGIGQWSASGAGMIMSGVGMSGVGMSGVGMSASVPPIRPRQFWLVADAELIVYGATEPDATLYVGDRPIPLSPDGTFRFQVSFQDGEIQYPIQAIAADGEQSRSIRMNFERETPHRHTNTKADAPEEWFED